MKDTGNFKPLEKLDLKEAGNKMYELIEELYPICRSITGEGYRQTLSIIKNLIPLEVQSVASGAKAFDWTIPEEWNIKDAYVKNSKGDRVIDFKKSNLHIVNYSTPVDQIMPLKELKKHLHTLPEHPDWIPYRTSYYSKNWGFCLSHNDFIHLKADDYRAVIDSTLKPGYLNYGELLIPGQSDYEVLISTHACHPSLCNDNLSGISLTAYLAKCLAEQSLRYSYRFLFIPGGIGSIVWLSRNEDLVPQIKHGLVVTCVGDSGSFTYKKTRQSNAEINRAVLHALQASGKKYQVVDFSPYGYDERNYGSPAFNLPVGSLTRSTYAQYPQYHSSADNLDLVSAKNLSDSLEMYLQVISIIENNRTYVNLFPKGEVQLGKRGLYGKMGGLQNRPHSELPLLWVLNFSDGEHSLLDICERAKLSFDTVQYAAEILVKHNLLKELNA
jgi:aminopeptidase-like protein